MDFLLKLLCYLHKIVKMRGKDHFVQIIPGIFLAGVPIPGPNLIR